MTRSIVRSVLMMSVLAGSLMVEPSESKAIFHWCRGCGAAPAVPVAPAPVYAPPVAAAAYYAPCAPPTVVSYVPQTYYRPVCVNTAVTTYQPVTSCGLCGPTTSMRPVTTMVQQTQLVPYTSYRMVYTAAYPTVVNYAAPVAAPSCGGCATAAYAPAVAPAPAAPPCCSGGSAPSYTPDAAGPSTMSAPSLGTTSAYGGTSTFSAPAGGTATYPAPTTGGTTTYLAPSAAATRSYVTPGPTTAPSPAPSGGNAPAFDPSQTTPPDIRFKPMPEDPAPQAGPTSVTPRQSDVDARTAARPLSAVRPVVPASYSAPARPSVNADAWRSSSR